LVPSYAQGCPQAGPAVAAWGKVATWGGCVCCLSVVCRPTTGVPQVYIRPGTCACPLSQATDLTSW